jgi:hypothetical protein
MDGDPSSLLRVGVEILDPVLNPSGFRFEFREAVRGSGGKYAWGEYVRGGRRLELHYRYSLGLVAYRIGELRVAHAWLMRALLGARARPAYPGFTADPLDGFRQLRQDLEEHGAIFLGESDEAFEAIAHRAIEDEQRRPRGFAALSDAEAR